MRTGVFAAGVLMMVIGVFMIAFLSIWGFGTEGGFGIFAPPIAGIGLLFLGFIVMIAGLAASPSEKPRMVSRPIQPQKQVSGRQLVSEKIEKLVPKPSRRPAVEKVSRPKKVVSKTEEVIYCMYCGEKLPSHAVHCRKCGKKVE